MENDKSEFKRPQRLLRFIAVIINQKRRITMGDLKKDQPNKNPAQPNKDQPQRHEQKPGQQQPQQNPNKKSWQ
jgi:hypothetical protein